MAPSPEKQVADDQSSAKPRIIIVDDSRLVRVSLSNVLQDEFEIVEAIDGEEGWEALLADNKIQVVLTDAGMPKLDGYGLIERIRTHEKKRLQEIPIIMITAAEDEESRQEALKIGATDFITKPFDKAQLLARVRAQAKHDQTTRELAKQSTDDKVTGIRSRHYFLTRGKQDLAFTTRHDQDLSVIVVGMDNFQTLRATGDKAIIMNALSAVAKALKTSIRTEDTLARTSNSHFAIIAPTLGWSEAEVVCNRIRQQISESPFNNEHSELSLTVSIGLVNHGVDKVETIEEYLSLAEKYVAKAQAAGGNSLMATE
ncbi:MAG: response regulator, partial [Gammaproteobacteria bacterium]|nr:response regulator [Gammaproteobacteria bacterium]